MKKAIKYYGIFDEDGNLLIEKTAENALTPIIFTSKKDAKELSFKDQGEVVKEVIIMVKGTLDSTY